MSANSAATAPAPPSNGSRTLAVRGVSYDTGANYLTGQGSLSREWWDLSAMRADLAAIRDELGANTVTVEGPVGERLEVTARHAVALGLRVHLQPILVDQPHHDILEHLRVTASLAESRHREGASVALSVGSEHLLFTPDIVPGATYRDRMTAFFETGVDPRSAAERLNRFLRTAEEQARREFSGPIYYAAGPFEDVDWEPFDLVGVNLYYSYHDDIAGYVDEIAALSHPMKPTLVCEFGSAPFAGGAEAGGDAWEIVDRSGPVPFVRPGHHRDEEAQARHARTLLDAFELARVHGATVGPFVQPTHPHSPEPSRDLDMACMAIVKTIRDDYDDSASRYRWEPKAAFHAIAERYHGYLHAEKGGAR